MCGLLLIKLSFLKIKKYHQNGLNSCKFYLENLKLKPSEAQQIERLFKFVQHESV